MNNYVIVYNEVYNNDSIIFNHIYKNIQGKTMKQVLEKEFNRKFERLVGERARYAQVILQKGMYSEKNNSIRLDGNGCRYCFKLL